jgi:pimeloyl-ACP methyl ester carboxylesterase
MNRETAEELKMPEHSLGDGNSMFYEVNDFTDPWEEPAGTVLFIHGFAESSLAWAQWVPLLRR